VISLENKGNNDIANHSMEVDFTGKQGSCWVTNGISSEMKESVGFQCIYIDHHSKGYHQGRRESIGIIQFIFHVQLNAM
jgi:hypothetical protein